jgi:hypothetical protein
MRNLCLAVILGSVGALIPIQKNDIAVSGKTLANSLVEYLQGHFTKGSGFVVHARDLKLAPLDQVNECTSIGPFRVEASGLAYRIQGAVEVQHHCYRFDVLTGVPNHAHPLSEAILKKKDA